MATYWMSAIAPHHTGVLPMLGTVGVPPCT